MALLVQSPEVSAAQAAGQPDSEAGPTRPRIGLVLSGGGARGAAHIGIIRVLEELRVPVDVITGTSMGSIIGGLYALGRSPDDMQAAIERIDWVDVFRDAPPRKDFDFRRKQDDFNFLTDLKLAFKDGSFFIPSGLIQGQKLSFWLRVLMLTSDGSAHFRDLEIPFKAIATDVETGEAVVLERGDVATAMRASMSIPGAFAPVDLHGRRLVDGGTANNLPVDVAKAMGVDVVIAIDISTPLREVDELGSAVGITAQMVGIPIQQNQDRQIALLDDDDVFMRPRLGDIGTASFTRMPEAVVIGEATARAKAARLSRYSISQAAYAQWLANHRRPSPELPVVDEIRIQNGSILDDRLLEARMRTRVGEPLDLDTLGDDLGRIHGTDAFDSVRFDLEGPEGRTLVIRAVPRARGRNYVRVGLNLQTDFGDSSDFNLAFNHVAYPLDRLGREWRSTLQIGSTILIGSEIYQPIGVRQRFYVLPSIDYERRKFDVFDGIVPPGPPVSPADRSRLAQYDSDLFVVGLEGGLNISNFARLQGGIGWVVGRTQLDTGDPMDQGMGPGTLPPDASFSGGAALLELNHDTLDNTYFPNHGSIGRVSGLFLEEGLGWDETIRLIGVSWATFRTWRKNTIGVSGSYRSLVTAPISVASNTAFRFRLGGFGNLSGFQKDSIVGESTFRAAINAYRRVASPTVFSWEFPVYVGGIFELGSAWNGDRDSIPAAVDPLLWSTMLFAGVVTPLGPLYVAYAYGEGGSNQGYLFLGQAF